MLDGQRLTAHELLGVVHHGREEALQGQLQVVVQVVLEVDGQVVLQRPDRVLRLLVDLHALGALEPRTLFDAFRSQKRAGAVLHGEQFSMQQMAQCAMTG